MADRVQIVITGSNQATGAFNDVVRDARAVGDAVEDASRRGGSAFDDFNKRAALLGAAIGSATLVLGEWSRAAAEDSANQARLQQSIENTGKSYDLYSEAVERAIKAGQNKAFSDDDVRNALVSLNTVTGDTAVSLDELGLTMDFARAKGIGLSTSAEIIARVYGGNLGILSRYGIQLDQNATKEEALAKLQQISAGQAETYAQSTLGILAKRKDQWDELTESVGAHTGALQDLLLVLPGLTSGYTALAGAVAGLGGFGAIASIAAPLAALIGSGAYAYNLNTSKGGWAENFTTSFLAGTAGALNWALPGDPFAGVQQQFLDLKKSGNFEAALGSVFMNVPGSNVKRDDNYWVGVLITSGVLPVGWRGDLSDAADYISTRARAVGVSNEKYVVGKLNTSGTYTYDPVSQSYVPSGYVPTLKANRYFELGGNLTSGATTMGYGSLAAMVPQPTPRYYGDITQTTYNGPYQPNTESSGGMGIGAKGPSRYVGDPGYGTGVPFSGAGGDSATGGGMQVGIQAADITPIIERERDAYYGLATAQQVAAQGLSEFKAVQDSILSHEGVYSNQISEYTSQLNAQDAAYEILKQRQEDGVALTKEQTDFMNNYAEATARGTAGVEDATVAQGLLAQQYLLNMEKGDQLNASLENQTGAVGDLVTVIEDLILSLDGVPDEVRARIELDRVAESEAELQTVIDLINQIEGEHGVHFSISADGGGVSIGNPNGPTISPDLALHGGVMGYRGGGVVARMAEGNNPELLRFRGGGTALALTDGLYNVPLGTYVTPAPATKQLVGGGNTYQFYAPLTIVANDPGQFAAALQEAALGSSR